MIKSSPLALALLALAACNEPSGDNTGQPVEDNVMAQPTADLSASGAAASATMVPPVGDPGAPAQRTIQGVVPSAEPSTIPGATNTAAGVPGATSSASGTPGRTTSGRATNAGTPDR